MLYMLYSCVHTRRAPEEQQGGWMSYIGKAIGTTASYLVSCTTSR